MKKTLMRIGILLLSASVSFAGSMIKGKVNNKVTVNGTALNTAGGWSAHSGVGLVINNIKPPMGWLVGAITRTNTNIVTSGHTSNKNSIVIK